MRRQCQNPACGQWFTSRHRDQKLCSRACIVPYFRACRPDFRPQLAARNQAKMVAARKRNQRARLRSLFPDVAPETAQLIYLRGWRAGWAQGRRERAA